MSRNRREASAAEYRGSARHSGELKAGRHYVWVQMPNRLAEATSPYLLQHKDNPVDWWEWGEDAFEEARRRDVPVLLSVGYAA